MNVVSHNGLDGGLDVQLALVERVVQLFETAWSRFDGRGGVLIRQESADTPISPPSHDRQKFRKTVDFLKTAEIPSSAIDRVSHTFYIRFGQMLSYL